MEPKLPAFIILEWSDEIDYWRLVAVADNEMEAEAKHNRWTGKGGVNLHILSTTEVSDGNN